MKSKDELLHVHLPKWPALLVKGKPVTKEQAMEIILRTDDMRFSSNDREFDRELNQLFFGVEIDKPGYRSEDDAIRKKLGLGEDSWNELWDYVEKCRQDTGIIELDYLHNSRIVSSWIGGPHGWCDWDGNIGCSNYNIGKYPSASEVYEEWTRIAMAFPYLDLTCQLLDKECGDGGTVAAEFRVKDGKVDVVQPGQNIIDDKFGIGIISRLNNPHGERGCTVDTFKEALIYVRNKFSNQTVGHE